MIPRVKVVAVVQARHGSSRLPGKVLRLLGSRMVLEHVLDRVRAVPGVDTVVVATTSGQEDDVIAEVGHRAGARVTRGPNDDVLARFLQAFQEHGGDVGIRITSDCPFIDPALIAEGLRQFVEAVPPLDYLSNTLERTYPRGYDYEVFRVSALGDAAREARQPSEREHVTPFLYRHPERFQARSLSRPDPNGTGAWRVTLDTEEDWNVIRAVFDRLAPAKPLFGLADVERLLLAEPALLEANRHVRQVPH